MAHFSGENLLCFRGERTVFADLSFTCVTGGALLLRGPNGSGKSTLLRLMAGLLKAHEGDLFWDGEAISEEPEAHNGRLHYVGHADAVKSVLTVSENIAFWSGLRSQPEKTGAALDAFGIAYLADVPGRFLSAGQKRRVNLARIKASFAPLWLLDEPTTALDAGAIADLEREIADHRASGGMVIASTHAELGLADAHVLNLSDYQLRGAMA
ncbi:MAG: heme ABC exporter ATP-binding protein CcmA [Rhodospirillales bacterium]|nr:heme ABC exporter ATP-binding protein CcmA [Rhodospirillales bacterium]